MSEQRLGDRFSGTRYVAVVFKGSKTGTSGACMFEDDAIWNAACDIDWPLGEGVTRGVLLRLDIDHRDNIRLGGICNVTPTDISDVAIKMQIEEEDEDE